MLNAVLTFSATCSKNEDKIIADIFKNYNRYVLPFPPNNRSVLVEFGMSLVLIVNVVGEKLPKADKATNATKPLSSSDFSLYLTTAI
ncbi:unnamed protein product [Soboliphyme baturini]|uniref:Neur_chan_LBD domain-containing protein n=1 Tax=Soboliphyme baturini TaxID=241478 RepID=A0A183I9C6_9BILA|nr:unnamed protein product [Soboliphyme baturini]